MAKFRTYWMWWSQSVNEQTLAYLPFKITTHSYRARNEKEATKKMNEFLSYARIRGRFLCVEEGFDLVNNGTQVKSHIEQILESISANNCPQFRKV